MSCNIGRVDLCFRHGDTADAWSMEFLDKNNKPLNLDGYEFFMEIRKFDSRVDFRTIGDGLKIEQNVLLVTKTKKERIRPSVYDYAFKMKEPDGDLFTFLHGKLTIEKELVDEDL